MTGAAPTVPPALLQQHGSLYFTRPTLVTYIAARKDLETSVQQVFSMVEKGSVSIEIGQRYALSEIEQAHRDLEAGRNVGSSLLFP